MTKKEIEKIIRDYHWMINEIARLKEFIHINKNTTSQYGIESTLPKSKNKISDPVYMEVSRRELKSKRMIRLENKVLFIQQKLNQITDEREITVLECLLDGLSIAATARHLGLSERLIYQIRDNIVNKFMDCA